MASLKGWLLVATPLLGDPNFERTVVLLLEHGDEGAVGVVLNRPSGYRVAEPLPQWDVAVPAPGVVFHGGPVSPSSVIGIAEVAGADGHGGSFQRLWPEAGGPVVGIVDLSIPPGDGVVTARVFAGYAGWGAGQLEDEVVEGSWYVLAAEPTDPFATDPAHLWRDVLARQPGDLARVALVPADPSLN